MKKLMESASSDFKRTYRFFIKLIFFGTRLIKILDLNWYVALFYQIDAELNLPLDPDLT